jgi:hypothetical protein
MFWWILTAQELRVCKESRIAVTTYIVQFVTGLTVCLVDIRVDIM